MASPDYDVFVTQKSKQTDTTPFIFKDKQYVQINDTNQGVYSSGQVQFDLTQIASSSLYFDAKASYLEIPFLIQVETDGTLATYDASKEIPVIMKNGAHNLIHSLEVYASGKQIIATQSFSNVPITYKLLTESSPADLKTLSPSLLFSDETTAEHIYTNALGHVTYDPESGFTSRQKGIINPTADLYKDFVDAAELNTLRQPYALVTTGDALINNKKLNINMIATIPLAHLHDFFQKLPLIKGSYFRMVLNLNAPCSVKWADGTAVMTTPPAIVSTTQVIPFQLNLKTKNVSPIVSNNADKYLSISCAIGNAFKVQGCTLHCAMSEFTKGFAPNYAADSVKTINYLDFLTYNNLTNVANGQYVQHQVTSGLGKLRHLLIVPQLSKQGGAAILPISSPYCSAPSCTAPCAMLTNFNVSVSGRNLYQSNIQYSWEHWLEQISYMGGSDGNPKSELGVKSGLLSEFDWQKNHRFIYVNLSNKDESEDEIPRSVTVNFTNRCKKPLDFYFFLFYEKSVSMDVVTGEVYI